MSTPSHLSSASKRWFEEIEAEYQLEPQHLRILQAAAECWDEKEAARKLLTSGLVITDRFGQQRPHPAVAIERDARLAFLRAVRELALEDSAPAGARPPRIGR